MPISGRLRHDLHQPGYSLYRFGYGFNFSFIAGEGAMKKHHPNRLPSLRSKAAAWELVLENQRLVYSIVRKLFRFRTQIQEDAGQVGLLALHRAAQRWKKGWTRFSTFATKVVISKLIRWDLMNNLIRVPIQRGYWKDRNKETYEKIIKALNPSSIHNADGFTIVNPSDNRTAIPGEFDFLEWGKVLDAMRFLPARWQRILWLRSQGKTLEFIRRKIKLGSRERCRQLEDKALAKLRQRLGVKV
jgi:RNA polymerase sigma factor (sigma-70 family)